MDMAEKEKSKAGQKRKANQEATHNNKRSKTSGDDQRVPTIVVPDDLIGKKVTHHCYGDDGDCSWFDETVIGTHGKNVKEPDYLTR